MNEALKYEKFKDFNALFDINELFNVSFLVEVLEISKGLAKKIF